MHIEALREHLVNGGRIEQAPSRDGNTSAACRLVIPPCSTDAYRDAQLDDYAHELPRHFAHRPPQHLHLRARFSHSAAQMKGTAGFGFWNHPFARDGAILEPPCNVWFFFSSAESNLQVARNMPGYGFKAALLNSGHYPAALTALAGRAFNALLRVPYLSSALMSTARAAVNAREAMLNLDMTAWHSYDIDWERDCAIFRVDGDEVLRAPHPPRTALGFVTWMDNYRATANANSGDYQFAYVATAQEQWLELEIMRRNE
jgi:hypothetical protein